MWYQHPPHTQLSAESEKASRACSGEKPGVSRLGSGKRSQTWGSQDASSELFIWKMEVYQDPERIHRL